MRSSGGEPLGRWLIIGIDPGTTTAYAALDFKKNLVSLWSGRGVGREELIQKIESAGTPAMVACDVATPPELVLKVAAAFNARLFSPGKDMDEVEKKRLAMGYRFSNPHELDALASALRAYHSVENTLRKVERVLREKGISEQRLEEAQQLVISGVRIEDVIESFVPREITVEAKAKHHERRLEEELARKDQRLRALAEANAELRKALERMEAEKKELEQRLSFMERGVYERIRLNREIRRKDATIARLRKLLRRLSRRPAQSLKSSEEKEQLDIERLVDEYRRGR